MCDNSLFEGQSCFAAGMDLRLRMGGKDIFLQLHVLHDCHLLPMITLLAYVKSQHMCILQCVSYKGNAH